MKAKDCVLVVREDGNNGPIPVLQADLFMTLPDGIGRVLLMTTHGCVSRPDVVQGYVVDPLGELGVKVTRRQDPPLPLCENPRLMSTNEELRLENQ